MSIVSKSYCYTLNNYTQEEHDAHMGWNVSYHVFGREKGEEGTPHLQGFVIFKRAYTIKGLKKLCKRTHFELPIKEATDEQRINYCKKDGDFFEVDNREQGKRTDIKDAYAAAEAGTSTRDYILAKTPNYQTFRVFQMAKLYLEKPRPIGPIEVINVFGPKGCGKSRWCWEQYPTLYCMNMEKKWWDGYQGEETILFDDVRPGFAYLDWWLRMLDIYPIRLEVKGGFVHAQFKRVLITTPEPFDEMMEVYYPHEDMGQLTRRITVKKDMKS